MVNLHIPEYAKVLYEHKNPTPFTCSNIILVFVLVQHFLNLRVKEKVTLLSAVSINNQNRESG